MDQSLLIVVQPVLDLQFQSGELSALFTKAPVGTCKFDDGFLFRGAHLSGHHRALLTPGQARVRMALLSLGTPAVALSTACIHAVKGASQDALGPEDLLEQPTVAGEENQQFAFGNSA